jgi:DeoD family purine-nucleoside phosphorylase
LDELNSATRGECMAPRGPVVSCPAVPTIHVLPTAALAERVLLPGDPGRALLLAQALLAEPKMFNHHRGLWGYTGEARDGRPLTIQSTGMGGPSAAIVIAELADLGARTLLRVGTCGALDASLQLGELLVATEALTADGTSRALGAGDRVAADPELLARLRQAGGPETAHGPVVSSDLFYDGPEGAAERWRAQGALAVEMETATLFALAARRGLRAGCALIVSDLVLPSSRRIDTEALHDAERRLGELAVAALTA